MLLPQLPAFSRRQMLLSGALRLRIRRPGRSLRQGRGGRRLWLRVPKPGCAQAAAISRQGQAGHFPSSCRARHRTSIRLTTSLSSQPTRANLVCAARCSARSGNFSNQERADFTSRNFSPAWQNMPTTCAFSTGCTPTIPLTRRRRFSFTRAPRASCARRWERGCSTGWEPSIRICPASSRSTPRRALAERRTTAAVSSRPRLRERVSPGMGRLFPTSPRAFPRRCSGSSLT